MNLSVADTEKNNTRIKKDHSHLYIQNNTVLYEEFEFHEAVQ